jgi:hypothetical protein
VSGIVRWFRTAESAVYVAAALVTAALTTIALQLWRADLGVPFSYSGDALATAAHFKTVIETGWYESQSLLGAPSGQVYHDFPTADNLHMLAPDLLRPFTSDWAVALNVYFLIGFLLTALAAVWFFRKVGISRVLSVVLAAAFALAPYHFLRGESHLFLASYYAVPLAMGLLVMILRRESVWGLGRSHNRLLAVLGGRGLRTALILVVLGSSSSYYSVFFIALLSFTGLLVLFRDRDWHRFAGAVSLGVGTVVVMLANMLPDLLFSWQNGANPAGLQRARGETEFLALKFVQLILPWPGHRVGALAALRERYDAAYLSLGEQPALGALAAAGFLASFVVIVLMLVGRSRFSRDQGTWQLVSGLSAITLFAFMCATVGGISTLVSFLTSSLRGWNRMSIVIAVLSLGIVGLLLDLAVRRFLAASKRTRSAFVTLPLAAVLLVVVVVDQTPGEAAYGYATTKAQFESDDAWVQSLEDALAPGSNVLLLPYIPYPENSASNGALASDQMIPYLHSTTLHWSNGGIKGRPAADWPGTLQNYPDADLVTLAASAGFAGIVVDRVSSEDHGAALEAAIGDSLGTDVEASPNGRFGFFDISDELAAVESELPQRELSEIATLITDPVVPYPTPSFDAMFDEDGAPQISSPKSHPQFTLENPGSAPRTVTVDFTVTSPIPDGSVMITWPDGTTTTEPSTDFTATVSKTLEVEPGSRLVGVTSLDLDGVESRSVIIGSLSVVQTAVERYLGDSE